MRDGFGGLRLRQAIIHRPAEVIGNLCDLAGRDERADRDQAAIARRKIRAAIVTMLRSRADRPGRFQTSPRSVPCVYFSRAGATIRTSSSIFVPSACVADGATRASVAMAAARNFIQTS